MVVARSLVVRLGIVAGGLIIASTALGAPKKKPLLRLAPQDFDTVEAVCGVKWQTYTVKGKLMFTGKLMRTRDARRADPPPCFDVEKLARLHELTRDRERRSWLDVHDEALATMLGKWAPICERANKAKQHNKRCRNPSKFRKQK